MSIEISRATAADSQDIASFLVHALPDHWRGETLPNAAQLLRVMSHSAAIAIIARQNGVIIGWAQGWCFPTATSQGDTAMLDELLIEADFRGNGIGTALVEVFTQTARDHGTAPVEIWATTDFPEEPAARPFVRAGGKQGALFRQFDWPQEAEQ